jgi:S-formylglutathione hydrolase
MPSELHSDTLASAAVGDDVEVRVLTPPGGVDQVPAILLLHGAMSSAASLDVHRPLIEALWATGVLPPAVVACASTPTQGGFYIDRPDGPGWETLVADELPAHLSRAFGVEPTALALVGASMGGYGVLKLVFRHPARYVAAAAVAPAVFPGETAADIPERNRPSVLGDLVAALDASPDDRVQTRLRANLDAIRAAEPALFLGVGDRDDFHLDDGTEHLHRLLTDLGVSHEYLLRRHADHSQQGLEAVQRAALVFVAEALDGKPGR